MFNFLGEEMSQEEINDSAKSLQRFKTALKRKRQDNGALDDTLLSPKKIEKAINTGKYSSKNVIDVKSKNKIVTCHSPTIPTKRTRKGKLSKKTVGFCIEDYATIKDRFHWADLKNIYQGCKDFYWPCISFPQSILESIDFDIRILTYIRKHFGFPIKQGYLVVYLDKFYASKLWMKNFICIKREEVYEYPNNIYLNINRKNIIKSEKNKSKYWTKSLSLRYDQAIEKINSLYLSSKENEYQQQQTIELSVNEITQENHEQKYDKESSHQNRNEVFNCLMENSRNLSKQIKQDIVEMTQKEDFSDMKTLL